MFERISDTEELNLRNESYKYSYSETKEIEDKFGISLNSLKEVDFSDVGILFSGLGAISVGGTALYVCSSILYGVGFGTTFHLTMNATWVTLKTVTIPSLIHNLFMFLKGCGLGIIGIGVYKTSKAIIEKKKTSCPIIKINGKRV